MTNSIPKGALALEFLKVSATRLHNRCENCGRRLKLKPGSFLLGTMIRFRTCRSCGHDNPTLSEAVLARLAEAGYDEFGTDSIASNIPACLGCGVSLLVSRDFTKIFCGNCGREWSREDLESDLGPIDPRLAGELPFPPDQSKLAQELEDLIEQNNIDAGTIYFCAELVAQQSGESATPALGIRKSFLEGWRQGKQTQPQKEQSLQHSLATNRLLAVHEECISIYTRDGEKLQVVEHEFSEDIQIVLKTKDELQRFREVVNTLAVVARVNQAPLQTTTQVRDGGRSSSDTTVSNLADEIERLLRLKEIGALTESEFQSAKSKLLGK